MDLNPNDGTRLSTLALGRYATGELSPERARDLEARLDDDARSWLDEAEAARDSLPLFDPTALRTRAGVTVSAAQSLPRPANRGAWFGALFALAAVAIAFALYPSSGAPVDPNYIGVRGQNPDLRVHLYDGGALRAWEGQAVGEGDRLGFEVQARGHQSVVLLSVDGAGQVSVYWPESGETAEPIRGTGLVRLPGSVVLDGAQGPEIFLAVFDQSPTEARGEAERAWQSGGRVGLVDWAQGSQNVESVVMERR